MNQRTFPQAGSHREMIEKRKWISSGEVKKKGGRIEEKNRKKWITDTEKAKNIRK